MTPPNHKHKTDNWYEPDDWRMTPSEKRLFAIKPTITHMSKKDKEKTTNIMEKEEIEALKSTYNICDENNCEETETEIDLNNTDIEETYKIYKNKNYDIFDEANDESHKTKLHSADKNDSDMIAVEPKDSSNVRKVQVGFRTWWLRFLQWFK